MIQQQANPNDFTREFDEVKYYYRVSEYIKTYQEGVPTYQDVVEFANNDLSAARKKAVEYYLQEKQKIKKFGCSQNESFLKYKREYHLPSDEGYDLAIALIECYEDDEIEHYIAGNVDLDIIEARELEIAVFNKIGIPVYYDELGH